MRENLYLIHVCFAHFAWETWKVIVADAGHVIFVMILVQYVKLLIYRLPISMAIGIIFQGLMTFVDFFF